MLRIILLSLVWAVCATCLIRPWFWKGVKNKNFLTGNVGIGFSNSWEFEVKMEIFFFVAEFLVSILWYAVIGVRQNLYGSFCMIIICVFSQCLWDNQGKVRYTIMLSIIAISAILWIQDGIVGYDINVPLNKVNSVPLIATQTDEDTKTKLFISSSEIESLFKADSASGPTYNNGKYIYTVNGGDNGKGIVTIDKDNYTEAKFIPCKCELDVNYLRSQYPTQKLKELCITISDDNVPYGLFASAEKTWLLGTYDVKGYVMLNLITGEIQEFKQEELPSFVTNN